MNLNHFFIFNGVWLITSPADPIAEAGLEQAQEERGKTRPYAQVSIPKPAAIAGNLDDLIRRSSVRLVCECKCSNLRWREIDKV